MWAVCLCQEPCVASADFRVWLAHTREHRTLTTHARARMCMRMLTHAARHMCTHRSQCPVAYPHCWIVFSSDPCVLCSWKTADLATDLHMSEISLRILLLVLSATDLCYWPWLGLLTKIRPADLVPHCLLIANPCLYLTWYAIVILYLPAWPLLNLACDLTAWYCTYILRISKFKFVEPTSLPLRPSIAQAIIRFHNVLSIF